MLIDVLARDPVWSRWSSLRIAEARASGDFVAGHVVVAELASQAESAEALDEIVAGLGIKIVPLDSRAAYLAGQAFREYRRQGGARTSILADFLIGAHALTLGAAMLTRDPRRFQVYFPSLPLITPENDNG